MSSEGESVATVPCMLHRSGEDYLKTILILQGKNGFVRRILRDSGYIEMSEDKRITLTEAGQTIAEQVYEKHSIIEACLIKMGVDASIAEKDACQMEHVASPQTIQRMKAFVRG